jgi:hypothetical protein
MSVMTRRSKAILRNGALVKQPRLANEDNLAWLARAARESLGGPVGERSLVLLLGGDDALSFRLRAAQSHVRSDLSPSKWSLALFVPGLENNIANSETLGVSLAPQDWYPPHGFAPPSNAIQHGKLARYKARKFFPNIALLALPVNSALIHKSINQLKNERSALDLPMLVLKWLQYCWGVGVPASPLGDGFGMPSAALLEAAFAANGFDLTPGLESRSSCPEAIWQSASWWHEYYATRADQVGIAGAYTDPHSLVPDPPK